MMRRRLRFLAALVATWALGSTARADFRINELLFNPPGGDNGQEYLEILSDAPGASLDDVWFVAIEGEGGAAGIVDQAVNLGGFATGSNGLFLLRDAATELAPAPESGTTVAVRDFSPDIENGANTFLLVRGFTGSVGLDLDGDNNGAIDGAAPWTSLLDGFSWQDPDGTVNLTYLDSEINALNPGAAFGAVGFTAEAYLRFDGGPAALSGIANSSAFPGPYAVSGAEYQSAAPFDPSYQMTPGGANVRAVPEPGSAALVGVGLAALAGLAWRSRLARA